MEKFVISVRVRQQGFLGFITGLIKGGFYRVVESELPSVAHVESKVMDAINEIL